MLQADKVDAGYLQFNLKSCDIIKIVEDISLSAADYIEEKSIKLIFERFVQVDRTSTRAREGSGIGLALTKSFVEMHGGSISVKSKLGEGSEFITEIPAVQASYESSCEECGFFNHNQNVEKISIEFSDIYD